MYRMIYRNLNNYSISYRGGFCKIILKFLRKENHDMKTEQLKVYSNATDVDVSRIPDYVWDSLAQLFWDKFTQKEAEQNDKHQAARIVSEAC